MKEQEKLDLNPQSTASRRAPSHVVGVDTHTHTQAVTHFPISSPQP